MTAREKIELSLCWIHGDDYMQKKCFCCAYYVYQFRRYSEDETNNTPLFSYPIFGETSSRLGMALIMMGVPDGVYETFELWEEKSVVIGRIGHCGLTSSSDPDWQRFIDEVVAIVDGRSPST